MNGRSQTRRHVVWLLIPLHSPFAEVDDLVMGERLAKEGERLTSEFQIEEI